MAFKNASLPAQDSKLIVNMERSTKRSTWLEVEAMRPVIF